MTNLISGSLAVLMMILFVGGLAVSIASVPFAIISFGVLSLTVVDFVQSVKNGSNNHRD